MNMQKWHNLVCGGKKNVFPKYMLLLKLLLINGKSCITPSVVANTSVHVSQTEQVAP